MAETERRVIGLYGNVAIERAACPDCGGWALVIGGRLACCDRRLDGQPPRVYRRMSEPEFVRRKPSKTEQESILDEQEHRCFYCDRAFGSHYIRNGRLRRVSVVWDHFLPYSMTANNYAHNFVAACALCNGIKSDRVFQTPEEARIYVQNRAEAKGIS